jgi:hypothetical protein
MLLPDLILTESIECQAGLADFPFTGSSFLLIHTPWQFLDPLCK